MPHTLLLADDSVTIQRVIELTFADEDVNVIAVSDGDQALARLESTSPDIVLADIGMPGKDGYEVAKHIKQSPVFSHIPVVLLTGAFEPVDQERANEAGCDGVLAKPFEPQLVISRVKELLAKSARRPAAAHPSPAPQPPAPPRQAPAAQPSAPPPPAPAAQPSTPPPQASAPQAPPPQMTAPKAPAPHMARRTAAPIVPVIDDTLDVPTAEEQWGTGSQAFTSGAAPDKTQSLDDYFDRLDEAFEHLGGPSPAPLSGLAAPPPAAPAAPPVVAQSPDIDWFGPDPSKIGPPSEPWEFPAPVAAATATEAPDYPLAYETPQTAASDHAAAHAHVEGAVVATPEQPVAAPAPPPELPVAYAAPSAPPPVAASAPAFAHAPVELPRISALPALSDAFAAILAAEENEENDENDENGQNAQDGAGAALWPATAPSTDALVDQVTQRVLDRLSDQVVRDTVSDIVSQIAERLVQNEIERIKGAIK